MLTVPIHDFQADVLNYLHLIKKGEQITVTENGESLATIASPSLKAKISIENLDAPFTKFIIGLFLGLTQNSDFA